MRKWSVEEFEGLIRHRLTDQEGPVELVAGKILPLPIDATLVQWARLLQRQIQQHLITQSIDTYVVRSRPAIYIDNHTLLKPSLALCDCTASAATVHTQRGINPEEVIIPSQVHWVLDIRPAKAEDDQRLHLYAEGAISQYWHCLPDQIALRLYSQPTDAGYQQHRLLTVGACAAPDCLPNLRIRVQEPLPLYFLTRTGKGQQTYWSKGLPISVEKDETGKKLE
ncbi:MAG: Uma2 family endonuclease [Cyanobacteria bacterium J06632_3]